MKILSFLRKLLGIGQKRIILQPRDGRIDSKEAEELAELIRTLNSEYKVDVADSPEQIGKGITFYEIIYVWIIFGSFTFLQKFVGKFAEEIAKIAAQWARERLKKKGRGEGRGFPTCIEIRGRNGKLLISIVMKDSTEKIEDQMKAKPKEKIKRKPPLIK